MGTEKKQRLGAGRVAFLARKEAIQAKIDAGHTMAAVYEEHEKDLGISYGQFVNYVNKFIRVKKKQDSNSPEIEGNKNEVDGEKRRASTLDSLKAKPNKEELL